MSHSSPPAIFHSRLHTTLQIYLSLPRFFSLSLSLLSSHPSSLPPFVSRVPSFSLPSFTVAVQFSFPLSCSLISVLSLRRWCNKRKRTAASIMRATLSQRDQQRLNCIRDSRTAHKFSSQRRGFLLNTRPSTVIRRVFSFHLIFLSSLYPSCDFTGYFRYIIVVHYTFYHSLKQ